jgi:hypothetical protein
MFIPLLLCMNTYLPVLCETYYSPVMITTSLCEESNLSFRNIFFRMPNMVDSWHLNASPALNPLANCFSPNRTRSSDPSPSGTSINFITGQEIANKLNPLAPCFEPLLTTSNQISTFGNTLNPNAPVFCVRNSLASEENENSMSTLDITPFILEIGTPDVSFEIVLSDDDQESLPSLSDNGLVSELIEQVPNPELSHDQITSLAPAEAFIDQESPKSVLKSLRQKNIDRIIIGSLNVNSIPNKIELLGDLIRGQVDIFLVSETKLNKSFPPAQFALEGFADPPCRLDGNIHGGGLQ